MSGEYITQLCDEKLGMKSAHICQYHTICTCQSHVTTNISLDFTASGASGKSCSTEELWALLDQTPLPPGLWEGGREGGRGEEGLIISTSEEFLVIPPFCALSGLTEGSPVPVFCALPPTEEPQLLIPAEE